jgi:hypothetical protein
VIPLHQVEAIQQAVEIGRMCRATRDLNDRLFDDRAFAALFRMHDFEFTGWTSGLITYSQDNKRQLIYTIQV